MVTKGECLGNSCRFYIEKPDNICFKQGVLPRCSPELKQRRKILDAAAPDLYEALKNLPRPKSILEEAAYTGGDVPKKWINDRGHFNDGYNQALKDVAKLREQALSKMEGKDD